MSFWHLPKWHARYPAAPAELLRLPLDISAAPANDLHVGGHTSAGRPARQGRTRSEAHMKSRQWYETLDLLVAQGAIPGVVHRILLWGPPGTGKSGWATWSALADRGVHRVTVHRDLAPEDLLGQRDLVAGPRGGTGTRWVDGPAVLAMEQGSALVLDEIADECIALRNTFLGLLDDMSLAQITLPTGRIVRPAAGYVVIATTNKRPSTLYAPLLDRFDIILQCYTPSPGVLQELPAQEQALLRTCYSRTVEEAWAPGISARSVRAYSRLASKFGQQLAAEVKFGSGATDFLGALATAEAEGS